MERKTVQIGGCTYTLTFGGFDEEDIDIDSLLKIDASNLLGEMITFPVIMNRFGMMLADAESEVQEAKLSLDITEAKCKERLRKIMTDDRGKAPTVDALNTAIALQEDYLDAKEHLIHVQKQRDYINSIFWSVKAKNDKLSELMRQSDLTAETELMAERANGMLIKQRKNLIE